jgi:Acyl-CoA dehydrogenase, N-terminal domain
MVGVATVQLGGRRQVPGVGGQLTGGGRPVQWRHGAGAPVRAALRREERFYDVRWGVGACRRLRARPDGRQGARITPCGSCAALGWGDSAVRRIGGLDEHPYSSAGPSFIGDADSPFRPDASLLDAARMLGPVIRDHSDFAEREGRLARPVIDAMRAAGMYRLMTPRTLGGLEIDPITFALIAEEIAGVDSAAAWSLQAGNTGAWWHRTSAKPASASCSPTAPICSWRRRSAHRIAPRKSQAATD